MKQMACWSTTGILRKCSAASASLCKASDKVKLDLPVYSQLHTKELQRIDLLKYERIGAQSKRFFCFLRSMVGAMGALRSAAPRSGQVNPVAPAALLISLNGDSSQLYEDIAMSHLNCSCTLLRRGLAGPIFIPLSLNR